MARPVEIEYLMKQDVSSGLNKMKGAAVSLEKTITQSSANIKNKVREQRETVKLVESDLRTLENQLKGMTPGTAWLEMKAEVEACRKVLVEEKVALADIEQQNDKAAVSGKRLSRELRMMQDAMTRMRLAGKQLTPEYAEMEQKAAVLADTLGDVRAQTNVLAHDNAGLQGVISGVSGLTGAITAGVGVMGIFTKNNEDLVKVQTKVQSVLAITMGLQQMMNVLNKDSAFRLVTLRKVKDAFTAANTRLAVALGISNVAAKALMATLTLGLSVAIGAAIALWDKYRSRQAAAKEEAEEFSKKVAESAAKPISAIHELSAAWSKLGNDMDAKKKFVEENKKRFDDLGVSVNSVTDAENLLVANKSKFVEACLARAKALAVQELAVEKYKEVLLAQQELEATPKEYVERRGTYKDAYGTSRKGLVSEKSGKWQRAEDALAESQGQYDKLIEQQVEFTAAEREILASIGAGADGIIEGSVAAIEKVIAYKRELLKGATNEEEYDKINKEIAVEERKLRAITGGGKTANGDNADNRASKLAELELRARQRIEDQALALREEGYEKERAAADLNFKREKDRIDREETERLALYEKLRTSGADVSKQDRQTIINQAAKEREQNQQLFDRGVADINKKEADDKAETYKQLLEPYRTYTEQRLEIEKQFAKEIDELRKGGASAENIALAEQARDRAIAELDGTMGATTDFWARIFDTFSSYTNKELETIIGNAREVLDYLNSTSSQDIVPKFGMSAEQLRGLKGNATELTAIYDALGGKIRELNARNPFGAIIRSQQLLRKNATDLLDAEQDLSKAQISGDRAAIKGAQERVDGLKRYETLLKGSLKDAVKSGIGYMSDLGSAFQQIGEAAGNEGLASFGKTLGQVAGIAGQFVSGDIIGGAISALTTGLTAIFSSRAKYRAALKQMYDDQLAFAHQYKLAMADIRLEAESASNAFGEDAFEKAIAALDVLKDSYADFIRLVNKDDSIIGGGDIKGINDYFKYIKQQAHGVTTDLQNIWIQTRNKTWFRSAKGEFLKDLYPELFDGSNGFNIEAARALLDTNNQLNDEAKRQLQEVIEMYDKWKEAEQAFTDYLANNFGEIGTALGDSIVSAFKEGTDAMEVWGKSFDNVLENLGKQMMQTIFFQDKFDELEDDIRATFEGLGDDPNELARQMQVILGNFYGGMKGTVQEAQEWYKQWAEEAKKHGFDLSGDTTDSGTTQRAQAGALTTITQDQGAKLEGLFTSVQMMLREVLTKNDDIGPGLSEATGVLVEIREEVRKSNGFLGDIVDDIRAIIRDGLKVK